MKRVRNKMFGIAYFTTACLLTLALGSKAEAQTTTAFGAPAAHAYTYGSQQYDVTPDPPPLVIQPKSAQTEFRTGGGLGRSQAYANINHREGFLVQAEGISPSQLDSSGGTASVAMEVLAEDPLGRDRVKVDIEFDAIAAVGAPLPYYWTNPYGSTATADFELQVGAQEEGGHITTYSPSQVQVTMPRVHQPPLLKIVGTHFKQSEKQGIYEVSHLFVEGNGIPIENRTGSGPVSYHNKITLNVTPGAVNLITIRAVALLNGFARVDPVVTPHSDNPEVVVTLRGAFDPNPPPLAILSPEELTAAGVDITPLQERGLFDPPAPTNHAPVARCQSVAVPAAPNSCAVASSSIDNGSSDPDGTTPTLTQSPAGPYPVGTTQVTLTVSDGSLSSQCTGTITVTDGQAPAITCPADQTVTATSSSGAAVNFTPSAMDNCSTLMIACSPASGATFPIGTTPVSCAATDGAGLQNSCSFNVVVASAPVPTVPFTNISAALEVERSRTSSAMSLEYKMAFTLGAGNNGIAPLTEPVTVQIGSLTFSIPAGSFRVNPKGKFVFAGVFSGVPVEVSITPVGSGRYQLKLEAKRLNVTGLSNSVATQVSIGNDTGSATVRAKVE